MSGVSSSQQSSVSSGPWEHEAEEANASLELQPVTPEDCGPLTELLQHPGLARPGVPGIPSRCAVEWTDDRRAFAVRRDGRLIGRVELVRDEDEPDEWELSLAISDTRRPRDGTRCALAATYYAFTILGAQTVWFWAPDDNHPVRRFAERYGFAPLHAIHPPGAPPAHVYELERPRWEAAFGASLDALAGSTLSLSDGRRIWRSGPTGFTESPARPS